ncbi:MAG TPA: hypothetical protein DDX85_10640 [Nitrospiraceae bacterium]|nr:hypothetical protein [Nitrospiraceae bacterium]
MLEMLMSNYELRITNHKSNKLIIRNLKLVMYSVWFLILALPSSPAAKTLHVGTDYVTIGGALEDAHDGDVIEVDGGKYKESLKIQKNVHLKGVNNPVISAPDGRIIEVISPGVIIDGFTFTYDAPALSASSSAIYIDKGADGVIIRDNRFRNVLFGIWNVEGRDIRIERNSITGVKIEDTNYRGNCVNLTGSQNVHVIDNTLNYCRDGIYMELCHDAEVTGNNITDSRYSVHTMWVDRGNFSNNTAAGNLVGLAIMYTKHSQINGNYAYGNRTHGLLLIQTVRSEISSNVVIGNTKGIFLYNSVYNEIKGNLAMNNQLGIHSWGGSEDNIIHGNSFINNEIQVKFIAGRDQKWDNNFWSDYIGWDMTDDGRGDLPYESNSVVDYIFWRYPVAKVLFASPALHVLWMLEKQFPILDVPKVIDAAPLMMSGHKDWKELRDKYSYYKPERIYGDIEKLPHLPGGSQ